VLIIVVVGSIGGLLIERFFYYRSKYKEKKTDDKIPVSVVPAESENPSHGERIMGLETDVENLRDDNEKDHRLMRESNEKDHGLIRKDIQKLFNLYNKGKK